MRGTWATQKEEGMTVRELLGKSLDSVFPDTMDAHFIVSIDGNLTQGTFFFDIEDGVILQVNRGESPCSYRFKFLENAAVVYPNVSNRPAEAFRGFFGKVYDDVLDAQKEEA
jgi:hypothetical protein